jgi:hypothetical protein
MFVGHGFSRAMSWQKKRGFSRWLHQAVTDVVGEEIKWRHLIKFI